MRKGTLHIRECPFSFNRILFMRIVNMIIDISPILRYSKYINVVRERSTQTPPAEREVHWLQDLFGMDMWNVAFKQHL